VGDWEIETDLWFSVYTSPKFDDVGEESASFFFK
jgi:hypothetical protein